MKTVLQLDTLNDDGKVVTTEIYNLSKITYTLPNGRVIEIQLDGTESRDNNEEYIKVTGRNTNGCGLSIMPRNSVSIKIV